MSSEELTEARVIGQEINGPGRQYFDDVTTDNIIDTLIEMSATLWQVSDRLNILETTLEAKGIDATALIESYERPPAEAAARGQERYQFVSRIFQSFIRRPK